MKHLLVSIALSIIFISGSALASTDKMEMEKIRFSRMKSLQIDLLSSQLTCIKAAQDKADMKTCREQTRRKRRQMELLRVQEQRKRLDERERKLREKLGKAPMEK